MTLPVSLPGTKGLSRLLKRFARKATISRAAGLLTLPMLQANSIRLEGLVHLAVLHCGGKERPGYREFDSWVNRILGATQAASMEDPVEDVFISNVETPSGNVRIFEGIWEANDFYLQFIHDVVNNRYAPEPLASLSESISALLKISEVVASRAGVTRWHSSATSAKGRVPINHLVDVADLAKVVTFTDSDLRDIGINRQVLAPFILRDVDMKSMAEEYVGESSLERRPLLDFGDCIVLALPPAISPAVRRYVLEVAMENGLILALSSALSLQSAALVRGFLREFDGGAEEVELDRGDTSDLPSFSDRVIKYDVNRYLHVMVLDDSLESLHKEGLSSLGQYPRAQADAVAEYIRRVSEFCAGQRGFGVGSTLIVMGGLGRGFALGFKEWPEAWGMGCVRISDLALLAGDFNYPVTRFLKCLRYQDEVERMGVRYININGDFNFYCFLRGSAYQLVPSGLPLTGGALFLTHDHVFPVRAELRRLADNHAVPRVKYGAARVTRFSQHSFFESLDGRPVYTSMSHLRQGILSGVVEKDGWAVWLTMAQSAQVPRRIVYEMWSGCIMLLDRICAAIESHGALVAEITIEFAGSQSLDSLPPIDLVLNGENPDVSLEGSGRDVRITFPAGFLGLFQAQENFGEQACARALAKAVLSLAPQPVVPFKAVDEIARAAVSDQGVRFLHLFGSPYMVDHVIAKQKQSLLLIDELDTSIEVLGLAAGCVEEGVDRVVGKDGCNVFLHSVVDKLWKRIKERLKGYRRESLIESVIRICEASMRDRDHWRQTALALNSIHCSKEDVPAIARKRESDRSRVSLAGRTIVEMAVCECSSTDGKLISMEEVGRLLSLAALFIEVATDSDAIVAEMAAPLISICENGDYFIDRRVQESVVTPFMKAYFDEEFKFAMKEYSELYEERPRVEAISRFEPRYSDAFLVEYGLTPDDLIEAAAECLDLAVARDDVVVVCSLGELRGRLMNNRGLSLDTTNAFIRMFSLCPRPHWEDPPAGFSAKEIHPWRFRRRLSATSRPLVVCGMEDQCQIIFGAGAVKSALEYLIVRSESGQLPGTFFSSESMRRYIGYAVDKQGHDFALGVGDRLRAAGWNVRNEVAMSELLAPSAEADGDVDVLAWRSTGEVLLIECKRLQMAKTIAEIAETCRKFRGEAKDELGKHLRRAAWVKNNPVVLRRIVGFEPNPCLIHDRLVTNTHVPMKYLKNLPIDTEKVGPLTNEIIAGLQCNLSGDGFVS